MNRDERDKLVDSLNELTTHGISDDAAALVKQAIAAIESPTIELTAEAASLLAKVLESAARQDLTDWPHKAPVGSVAMRPDDYSPTAHVKRDRGAVVIEVRQHWT